MGERHIDWDRFARDIKLVRRYAREYGCELSERIGISASTACRAQQGKPVTADTYMLLCRELALDPFEYLNPTPESEGE